MGEKFLHSKLFKAFSVFILLQTVFCILIPNRFVNATGDQLFVKLA